MADLTDLITRRYGNFRGVDFSNNDVAATRSPLALNMWKNYKDSECIETRPGMTLLNTFGNKILGLFFLTINNTQNVLVHVGTKLLKWTNYPTTPATTTPSTTTPPETIPPIPVFTVPWTDIIYTGTPGGGDEPGGGGSYGPDSPRTGLDAIYGTGDSKQSATGLGALAGLAAGAAGLGLTGLIGDKDDEDEEEDSRTEFVEEGKSDVAIEAKPEQQDSEKPQMF